MSITNNKPQQPYALTSSSWKACVAKDGVDHINIAVKGNTELGRFLAHFSKADFEHPKYGPFVSIEGFWYWLKSVDKNGVRDDRFRMMDGATAHSQGKRFTRKTIPNFINEIIIADYHKVMQNEKMMKALIETNLPFTSYYQFNETDLVIVAHHPPWVIDGFNKIRNHLKNHKDQVFKP